MRCRLTSSPDHSAAGPFATSLGRVSLEHARGLFDHPARRYDFFIPRVIMTAWSIAMNWSASSNRETAFFSHRNTDALPWLMHQPLSVGRRRCSRVWRLSY